MTLVIVTGPTTSTVTDIASAQDIRNCFRQKAEDWPVITQLAVGGLADSGTALSLTDDTNITTGLYVQVDQEWILVTDGTATPWTVLRAQKGTTAAAHDGFSEVLINPRWGNDQIDGTSENVIASLWPEIYAVQTFDFTPDGSALYEAPSDIEDVLFLSQETGSSSDVFEIDGKYVPIQRTSASVFSSGVAIRPPSTGDGATDITVFYRTRVTQQNLEAGLGLVAVCWGTASRLLTSKLIPRTAEDSRANPQMATTSDGLRAVAGADQEFQRAKARWKAALRSKWHPTKRWRTG